MDLLKLRFRNQAFRSLQGWYEANQKDFSRKLSVVSRNKRRLEFVVEGIPKEVMTFILSVHSPKSPCLDAAAHFYLNGECLDSAIWLEAFPVRCADGYRCAGCLDIGDTAVYSNREAIWESHVFQPLMTWINHVLAHVVRIDFCKINDEGSSWVNLITDELIMQKDEAIASFPLPVKNEVSRGWNVYSKF